MKLISDNEQVLPRMVRAMAEATLVVTQSPRRNACRKIAKCLTNILFID